MGELELPGLMTDAGRAAQEAGRPGSRGPYGYVKRRRGRAQPDYAARLAASPKALAFFESEIPWYRRT